MGALTALIKSPIKDILGSVGDIIGKFVTDPSEKLKAQLELTRLEADFNLKMAELDGEWAKTQASVINTEATSASWLTRNWRPLMMLFFAVIIGTVVWTGGFVNGHLLDHDFIMEILSTIKLGLSGYVAGRSVEKVTPAIIAAIKK